MTARRPAQSRQARSPTTAARSATRRSPTGSRPTRVPRMAFPADMVSESWWGGDRRTLDPELLLRRPRVGDFTGWQSPPVATPTIDWDEAPRLNLVADQRRRPSSSPRAPTTSPRRRLRRRNDLKRRQGTGHGAAAAPWRDDPSRTAHARVEVDPDARPPARGRRLSRAERPRAHGCSMPGSSPDVGVRLHAGGGFSWLGCRYGFACNRVGDELVTPTASNARSMPRTSPTSSGVARRRGRLCVVTALS